MRFLGPTRHARLNEAGAVAFLITGLFLFFSLVSYYPLDSSWNTSTSGAKPVNLTGLVGASISDLLLQGFGLGAYVLPLLVLMLAWRWLRGSAIAAPWARLAGGLAWIGSTCTALGLFKDWHPIAGALPAGGLIGLLIADYVVSKMNVTGAVLVTGAIWILSLYLISTFEMSRVPAWFAAPIRIVMGIWERLVLWRAKWIERSQQRAQERAEKKAAERAAREALAAQVPPEAPPVVAVPVPSGVPVQEVQEVRIVDPLKPSAAAAAAGTATPRPMRAPEPLPEVFDDIPIRALESQPEPPLRGTTFIEPPEQLEKELSKIHAAPKRDLPPLKQRFVFQLPSTELLQEAAARSAFDSQELKDTAGQIKSKFEEFNVRGSVVQINPGPVVTTFEFKPEAGVKYTRITTLSEDLCLGLQAESILIERIPGKPTVGIEVPNTKRETISLRQILESDEFLNSASKLTVALGKDINGRIKVAALESMPHLLIAGSTGSGKSVMLNTLIMSILYKATPHEVRMIMVDPKRLEFGPYEGIPHLLTPVITDARKATIALRNAVLEMERRLKLLAGQGVRNIEQFNKKVRQLESQPRNLFEEELEQEELEHLPYVLIVIDELADLMMLERANVEESVTRLAQMARAVGMHLVLATQRPSVDVITGLIKANFPSRISFRVATRVDSRTVLDVMGAEHLLGKGDMLYLPPGSSRLTRVHGSFVSEAETNRVVDFWKQQAQPEYDQTFLIAPPADDEEAESEAVDDVEDPLYQEAVRVVCDMGKASTSTLQRRLRLGYGRAARILDMMQRDGIIGPPDGSRPRDVLKRPDWLEEIANQVR
ncbi:MAG: DNA translocase FtsK [Acidobacteriia bacterium]|nr:DNA translocase FtsK [Terriglobia bacterium]